MNRRTTTHNTEQTVRDGEALDRATVAARRRVIRLHRLPGVPLVIWQDGRVVEIAPEDVELPAEHDLSESPDSER